MKFDEVANLVPFQVPADSLVLWSGAGTRALATAAGTELTKTALGKLLDGLSCSDAWPNVHPLWAAISRKFVTAARGQVKIFLGCGRGQRGGIRPEAVFGGSEKESLETLAASHPALKITYEYHCVAQVGAAFVEGVGPFPGAASVPPPTSLYWTTGEPGDVSRTNPAALMRPPVALPRTRCTRR